MATSKLEAAEQLKKQIQDLEAELEETKEAAERERKVIEDVEEAMEKYEVEAATLVQLLTKKYKLTPPQPTKGTGKQAARWTKVYVHRDTKKELLAASGASKTLREWKKEYGDSEVETWRDKAKELAVPANKALTPPKNDPIHK